MKKLSRNERLAVILKLLNMHKELSNQKISTLLAVTAKTVRCDLVQLEKDGLVKRVHGGVCQSEGVDIKKYSLDAMLAELLDRSILNDSMALDSNQGGLIKMKHNVFDELAPQWSVWTIWKWEMKPLGKWNESNH